MSYPDNMNWQAYDRTIGSVDDASTEFESVAVSECNGCLEVHQLNTDGLCKCCDESAKLFNKFAAEARAQGRDPFTAGMIAQRKVLAEKESA